MVAVMAVSVGVALWSRFVRHHYLMTDKQTDRRDYLAFIGLTMKFMSSRVLNFVPRPPQVIIHEVMNPF